MTQVGNGDFRYEPVQDFAKLPAGMSFGKIPSVATDTQDRLYVFQRSVVPMHILDSDGNYLSSWGAGILTDPHGICVDTRGNIYTGSTSNCTVDKYVRRH